VGRLTKLVSRTDVTAGKPACLKVEGRSIALFEVEGAYLAIDDECTHAGGPLSEGEVVGGCVVCPWHGARFDLRTGAVLEAPAEQPVRSYPVSLQGGDLWIELD